MRLYSAFGLSALFASTSLIVGCGTVVVEGGHTTGSGDNNPSGSGAGAGSGTGGNAPTAKSDKVDILFVVDNSSSMLDKQQLLGQSIAPLIKELANPPCISPQGGVLSQPASPTDACPAGSTRRVKPVQSIHFGVITSSLGGLGSESCPDQDAQRNNNDMGQLVTRGMATTYQNQGFLAWDPQQALNPPGQADLDAFVNDATDLVVGVGQIGCGYEMPLESAYRFLADPNPYASVSLSGAAATFSGTDQVLLQERQAFLRPDSLLSVVLLSDENDCSVQANAQDYLVLNPAPFFRGSDICATDPNNTCCYSCGLQPPPNCQPCSGNAKLTATEDDVNLKCWHQKERYGFNFLYPVARYVNAFSQGTINPTSPDLSGAGQGAVANPLFAEGRSPDLFVMTAIVGVPWESIAVDPNDPSQGTLTASQMNQNGVWDRIAGNPDTEVFPTDAIMTETYQLRPGVTPSDPNGGDRPIDTTSPGDLQYACIFPLPVPNPQGADCFNGNGGENPVCQGTTQVDGKAYPGLRELAVLKGLGNSGTVGSICAPRTDSGTNPSSPAFAYNNAIASTIRRMSSSLEQ